MAIEFYTRLVSNKVTVHTRATREEAIAAALAGGLNTGTVEYGNLPGGMWPELRSYENENSLDPRFIWANAQYLEGQRLGFAAVIELPRNEAFAHFLATFADNAHDARVDLYVNGEFYYTVTGELEDGSMFPGTVENRPFNWQLIRLNSGTFYTPNFPLDTIQLVISFEVQNYLNFGIPATSNPAALAFWFDLYRDVPAVANGTL